MAKIKYTIEPTWTRETYSDTIEIPDEDLDGYTPDERVKAIEEVITDAVNAVNSWGWEELPE